MNIMNLIEFCIASDNLNRAIDYEEKYKDLQQRIDKAIKVLEECKMLFPHEFSWEEQADNLLEILKGKNYD